MHEPHGRGEKERRISAVRFSLSRRILRILRRNKMGREE
jgi:hypothetical protein